MTLDVGYGPQLTRDGQSRAGRFAKALDPSFVKIDGRGLGDLVRFVYAYAAELQFTSPVTNASDGDWQPFFAKLKELPEDRLSQGDYGDLEPHAALVAAFLLLFRHAQDKLNSLSKAHLDFYYERVLRLARLPSVLDRAHLVFELKKNSGPFKLAENSLFSAGKDAQKRPLQYRVLREVVLNQARVASLRSIFLDRRDGITVRKAPIANSADGVGAVLDAKFPRWKPFGDESFHPAELGFAVSSPLLAMAGGTRSVDLRAGTTMEVSAIPMDNILDAYVTGPKGWIGPKPVGIRLEKEDKGGTALVFSMALGPDDPPVKNYDAALHGGAFETNDPVLQFVLNTDAHRTAYPVLVNLEVAWLRLTVNVEGISQLIIRNDLGDLDPSKPFMPFGPVPVTGSNLWIGHSEAFSKDVKSFSLRIDWRNVPEAAWASYYGYTKKVFSNSYFQADLRIPLAGWVSPATVDLFEPDDARKTRSIEVNRLGVRADAVRSIAFAKASALAAFKSNWAGKMKQRLGLLDFRVLPVFSMQPTIVPGSAPMENAACLTLKRDFFHQTYREEYTRALVAFAKTDGTDTRLKELKEAYTPVIQSLSLGYTAETPNVDLRETDEEIFLGQELHFHHVAAFGQRREHAFIRRGAGFPVNSAVSLLPGYDLDGELLIGMNNMNAGSNLTLLFQAAEGTGNPDRVRPTIQWSVLCDNQWRSLVAQEILSDTTNGLLTSGVIEYAIPAAATTDNTLLPSGLHWLRAGLRGAPDAVCDLVEVIANAVEVERVRTDPASDGESVQALAPGSITKPVDSLNALKSVRQPYAGYGGKPPEDDPSFYARASERLRHKNRAVSLWDYERLVLSNFPEVYKVKCLDHTAPESYVAPGHVTLVVIPALHNLSAGDPLRPRIDLDTRERIREFIEAHCSRWIEVHVENPDYQELVADFQVHFHSEFDAGFYEAQLNSDLEKILSPWAFEGGTEPAFGGRIHKSVVLRAVEQLKYVDYVREFHLFHTRRGVSTEVTTTPAVEPRALLVSSTGHRIKVI